MTQITPENKLKAVKKFLAVKNSSIHKDAVYVTIAREFDISVASLYNYAQDYIQGGEKRLLEKSKTDADIRERRIAAYLDKLRDIDIKAMLFELPAQELRVVIDQAKIELAEEMPGEVSQQEYEPAVVDRIIHLQLNEVIAEWSEEEKTFLRDQRIAVNTYACQVGEYRKEVEQLLDPKFVSLQTQYRIRRKELRDIINQRCMKADELDNELKNIKNDEELLELNREMAEVQQSNITSRAAQIALYKLTVGREVQQQRKEQYERTKEERQKKYTLINEQKFIKIAEGLLNSDDYHELILGICALTGRRTIEVAKIGVFGVNDDESMIFSGQAKKRTEEAENKVYTIPVLGTPRKIIEAHNRLKILLEKNGFDEDDSNKSFNNRLFTKNERVASMKNVLFSPIYPDQTEEKDTNLRAIYASICYRLFKPQMGFRAYTAMILNHENMASAESYDRYESFEGEDNEE